MKPMLAAPIKELLTLRFPKLVSPKLDGVRCLVLDGVAYSRNLKPIRNEHVQRSLARLPHGTDGELVVGPPVGPDVFNRTQSGVMSFDGEPDFKFYVFDMANTAEPIFERRLATVAQFVRAFNMPFAEDLPHQAVYTVAELLAYEQACLSEGYEGVMLRDPAGPYKHGRSTEREGWLLKLKRFHDAEAKVVGIEEAEENLNEAFRDELGRLKRRATKDAVAGKAMLGTILGRDLKTGKRLRIAPGTLTHAKRYEYWAHPEQILGRIITYRFFEYGAKDLPRFPRFYGFREDLL